MNRSLHTFVNQQWQDLSLEVVSPIRTVFALFVNMVFLCVNLMHKMFYEKDSNDAGTCINMTISKPTRTTLKLTFILLFLVLGILLITFSFVFVHCRCYRFSSLRSTFTCLFIYWGRTPFLALLP